ncbi:MAG: hypothetical protein KAR31_09065 [Candidatus Omnitrophica bacterium]|nr:hypothetical protein [Candidatus Omnitrophota bacterium]
MVYPLFLIIASIVIVILLFFLERAFHKITELEHILADERRKRSMPILTLEVNTDNDYGLFLINDSYCYAKNIQVSDLDVVVDYGFKKHITLKFDALEMLKPNGRSQLNYRVFDGDYDTTATDTKNILNHFPDAPISMNMRYENIESELFSSTIIPEKDQYIVKEVISLHEKSR